MWKEIFPRTREGASGKYVAEDVADVLSQTWNQKSLIYRFSAIFKPWNILHLNDPYGIDESFDTNNLMCLIHKLNPYLAARSIPLHRNVTLIRAWQKYLNSCTMYIHLQQFKKLLVRCLATHRHNTSKLGQINIFLEHVYLLLKD